MPIDARAPRVLVRAAERGDAFTSGHPYNALCELSTWPLSRLAGLARIAVNLARLRPGKESAIFHLHHREEEWLYVLSGRGVAEVDDAKHEVGPGDFLGFPPGVGHHLRNPGGEDLVYVVGGEVISDVEVADFPRLGRRLVRFGARLAVYPVDAEVPFVPAEVEELIAAMFGVRRRGAPPRVLVRAAERGDAKRLTNSENPLSEVWSTPLSRRAGLERLAVNHVRVAPGKDSFVHHLHHAQEEWMLVLSGRGIAEVRDAEHEIAPGDFLGFPARGPGHNVRNRSGEDLVYLAGGDASGGVDVVDYPRLGKRKVFVDARTSAVHPIEPR